MSFGLSNDDSMIFPTLILGRWYFRQDDDISDKATKEVGRFPARSCRPLPQGGVAVFVIPLLE